MKKLTILFLLALIQCSSGGTKGVTQSFIKDKFNLSTSSNPTVVNLDPDNTCPKFEFDTSDTTSFQLRISEGTPLNKQSKFKYADDEYSEDGAKQILKGSNSSTSTFEFTFDGVDQYSITVDYKCELANQEGCVTTQFRCNGVLQDN